MDPGRQEGEDVSKYEDEWGHHMGYCNACGNEAVLGLECCEDGEVVPYDDDDAEAP